MEKHIHRNYSPVLQKLCQLFIQGGVESNIEKLLLNGFIEHSDPSASDSLTVFKQKKAGGIWFVSGMN